MTLLAAYDQACKALADVTSVKEALGIAAELEHVKLYARRVQDKELLERATIRQLRTERRLGELILEGQRQGLIAAPGRRPKPKDADQAPPAKLEEIGLTPKMSAKAQKAAAPDDDAFEEIIETTREKLRSGRAILVDPIQAAAKEAEIADRRRQHAERSMKGCKVEDLVALAASGFRAGLIGMDPQWHFKVRSEAGEGRSAGIHYKTEEVEKIKAIPVGAIAADDCCLAMWTVDWCLEQAFALMRHYGFEPVTKLFTWAKTNECAAIDAADVYSDRTWSLGQGFWSRANPEDCWLATRGHPKRLYADVRQLIVAPVMEHSRKPDEWLARAERLVAGPYIELNARRPRRGWFSWGDELEWTGVAT